MKKDFNFSKKARKHVELWLKTYIHNRCKFYSVKFRNIEMRIENFIKKYPSLIQMSSLIGLIITAIALGISIWQTKLSINSSNDSQKILEAVSTKYINEFPKFLDDINECIEQAKDSIVIKQDVLNFGSFSSPAKFHKFLTIIKNIDQKNKNENKNKHITIMFQVYDNDLYEQETRIQFLGYNLRRHNLRKNYQCNEQWLNCDSERVYNELIEKDFEERVKNKHKIEAFIKHKFANQRDTIKYANFDELEGIRRSFEAISIDTLTYKEFSKLLCDFKKQVKVILNKFDNVIIIDTIQTRHTMFSWQIDGKKAIFCFPGNDKHDELAFSTEDPKFLTIIQNSGSEETEPDNTEYQ